MKKLLSLAVATMFVASMAFAQGPTSKPTSTESSTKKECASKKSCCSKEKKACADKKAEASSSTVKPAAPATTTVQSPK